MRSTCSSRVGRRIHRLPGQNCQCDGEVYYNVISRLWQETLLLHLAYLGSASRSFPTALLNNQNTTQVAFMTGPEVHAIFNDSEGTFNVSLSLHWHVAKDVSVLKHTSFHIPLKLKKKHQPMKLKLNLTVKYKSKSFKHQNKTLHNIGLSYSLPILDVILTTLPI